MKIVGKLLKEWLDYRTSVFNTPVRGTCPHDALTVLEAIYPGETTDTVTATTAATAMAAATPTVTATLNCLEVQNSLKVKILWDFQREKLHRIFNF